MKTILAVLLTCVAATSVFAQGAPATVSFAARLQDAGQPLTGNHDFVFALFDAPTAGSNLWQETRTGVALQDGGLLYLDLGSVTPLTSLVFAGNARYLEITIDGVVSSPRVLIESVPYSLRSAKAYDAEGLQGHAASFFQQAVASSCSGTSSIQTVNPDGTVTCTTGPLYTAGTGLLLAGGVFSADFTTTQARITGTCTTGAVNAIAADGTVTCVAIPNYTAGSGISIAGNTIGVDFTTAQHALTTACLSGGILNTFTAAGTPTCYGVNGGLQFSGGNFSVDTTVIEPHISPQAGRVDTVETRNNAAYGDLATVGPSATAVIPPSGAAIVTVTGQIAPPSGCVGYMSFTGGGIASADNQALIREAGTSTSTGFVQASATFYVTGIAPGTQQFTAKYRSTGGTVTFSNRHIIVTPLP